VKSKQPGSSGGSTALRALLGLSLVLSPFAARAQHFRDFTAPQPLPAGAYLVIGFTGGIEHWDTAARPVRKLALDLREQNIPNVYVETVEHRHRGLAMKLIVAALDRNRDGRLDAAERQSARIILYGHSMGGAAVVKLARELHERHIPVLLTVQVDSIGASDSVIPANVARAANFYQHTSHVLRGVGEIRAADPAATEIVGNFGYDYAHRNVDLAGSTLPERIAGGAHTKMEFDPEVWARVRRLILLEVERRPAQ
jgi:pimeloyl-ACP methyl ester carboxylesterase